MRSRTLLTLAAISGAAACSVEATAPPREEPAGPSLVTASGCPGGFVLTGPPLTPGSDENADGLVCVLTFQAGPEGRTFYLERDNKT